VGHKEVLNSFLLEALPANARRAAVELEKELNLSYTADQVAALMLSYWNEVCELKLRSTVLLSEVLTAGVGSSLVPGYASMRDRESLIK
jgi:hypothetical protein